MSLLSSYIRVATTSTTTSKIKNVTASITTKTSQEVVKMNQNKSEKILRVGMIGAGTVGGGVYELLYQYYSDQIQVTKICVRSLEKARTFTVTKTDNTTENEHTSPPPSITWTTDPASIYNDPDIDCVVEVMGGTTLAKDIVLNSLRNRKSVVTANKALLAEYLDEIQSTLQVAQKEEPRSVYLGYEAAVCGGIPIINILSTTYGADTIQKMMGICNGTTNFMLSAMCSNNTPYEPPLEKSSDTLEISSELEKSSEFSESLDFEK